MNYEHTDDLDFGAGDTTIDPKVRAGKNPATDPRGTLIYKTI